MSDTRAPQQPATREVDEEHMRRLHERGAVAWGAAQQPAAWLCEEKGARGWEERADTAEPIESAMVRNVQPLYLAAPAAQQPAEPTESTLRTMLEAIRHVRTGDLLLGDMEVLYAIAVRAALAHPPAADKKESA